MQTHEVEFNLNFRMNKTCKLNRQLIKSVLVLGLRSFSFFLLFYFLLEILFRILFIHSCFSLSLTCFFILFTLQCIICARREHTNQEENKKKFTSLECIEKYIINFIFYAFCTKSASD